MSYAELLFQVTSLSRDEKVKLIQAVSQQLTADELSAIKPGGCYPVFSPDNQYAAAAALLKVLEAEKAE